jgi:hypothetical protein
LADTLRDVKFCWEAKMAKRPQAKVENPESPEHRGVVVGWTHHDLGSSIDLRIQSAVSQAALDEKRVDSHHFLMTYNQALLLAKFLLDTTGQSLPPKHKKPLWLRLLNK